MSKEQKTFTREFKQEAVQLVRSSNKSQAQIARDLGIADSTLHHWCKLFTEDGEHAFPGSGHQKPQEEEIRSLKRELEITKQERDILKKRWVSSRAANCDLSLHCRARERVPRHAALQDAGSLNQWLLCLAHSRSVPA